MNGFFYQIVAKTTILYLFLSYYRVFKENFKATIKLCRRRIWCKTVTQPQKDLYLAKGLPNLHNLPLMKVGASY